MSKPKFPDFLKLERDLNAHGGNTVTRQEPPDVYTQHKAAQLQGIPQLQGISQPTRYPPTAEVLHVVKTFGELPTKEIDDLIEAAENEIAELKREAQGVRNLYTEYTTRITEDIKRLQTGVAASLKTMQELREHCAKLNEPLQLTAEPVTDEPPEAA